MIRQSGCLLGVLVANITRIIIVAGHWPHPVSRGNQSIHFFTFILVMSIFYILSYNVTPEESKSYTYVSLTLPSSRL